MHQNAIYLQGSPFTIPVSYLNGRDFGFSSYRLDLRPAANFNLFIF